MGRRPQPGRGTAGGAARPRVANRRQARPAPAAAAPARALRLPRTPKGRRARFFDDPATDQLFGIVAALTAELSVAFERIETLERVLESRGTLDRAQIEAWVPEGEEAAARAAAREALIERVFQVLEDYAVADPLKSD